MIVNVTGIFMFQLQKFIYINKLIRSKLQNKGYQMKVFFKIVVIEVDCDYQLMRENKREKLNHNVSQMC